MTVSYDAEGQPAKPAAHPSVRAVLSRRRFPHNPLKEVTGGWAPPG